MNIKGKKILKSFSGYLMFFAINTLLISSTVLIYDFIESKTNDKAIISICILFYILFIALFATIIDLIREKVTVERPIAQILEATKEMAGGNYNIHLLPQHKTKYNRYDMIKINIDALAKELKEVELLHNDFISNVSHEIKTPLSIIKNYAQALEKATPGDEKKYIDTIIFAANRLTNLVNNMKILNKLENDGIKPNFEEIELNELLGEVILSYEQIWENKGLELSLDIDEISMVSVKTYLEIVWSNLISNALKFTDSGMISISLKEKNKRIFFSIKDTGCGISNEVGKHIFDKFYQGDTSHSQEGNGLGLSMVKKIIDLLGGEITVSSALGKGSTFTVILDKMEENDEGRF